MNIDGMADQIRQMLRNEPVGEINVIVRGDEIFANATPQLASDMARYKTVEITVRFMRRYEAGRS